MKNIFCRIRRYTSNTRISGQSICYCVFFIHNMSLVLTLMHRALGYKKLTHEAIGCRKLTHEAIGCRKLTHGAIGYRKQTHRAIQFRKYTKKRRMKRSEYNFQLTIAMLIRANVAWITTSWYDILCFSQISKTRQEKAKVKRWWYPLRRRKTLLTTARVDADALHSTK